MIAVPKTPFDGLPTLDKSQYKRVWRSAELRAVRHADFEYEHSRQEPSSLTVRVTDDAVFSEEILVYEVQEVATGLRKFVVIPNLLRATYGAAFGTVDEALAEALRWRDIGVIEAVREALPSIEEVAQRIADMFDGKLPRLELTEDEDPRGWAGDIR